VALALLVETEIFAVVGAVTVTLALADGFAPPTLDTQFMV
jgi:hypothetical protein